MDTRRLLPPNPNGWYALSLSAEISPGKIRSLEFMDQEYVLFRTQSGVPCVMEAYCPHLGAHIGHGGQVQGESVRCPFHGFCFDVAGNCTFIPYGTRPPPKAKAAVLPIREKHGLILAYYDSAGQAPTWEVPDLPTAGWSRLLSRRFTLRGHPQETTENSVDLGHFSAIHGYTGVEKLKDLVVQGPCLNVAYAMTRPTGPFKQPVRSEFEIFAYGLGYSRVEVRVPHIGLQARLFVLATPTRGENIQLRVALSFNQARSSEEVPALLRLVPRRLFHRLAGQFIFDGLVHDVQQDFVIWQHKRYVQPPILADGDGPVGKYRQWAKQFYHSAEQALI